MSGGERIEAALARARVEGRLGLIPYLMGGFPDPTRFDELLVEVARRADVVEVGLPFTDPVADGPVIQEAGRRALAAGVDLERVLAAVARLRASGDPDAADTPLVLMTYLNPLFARGLERSVEELAAGGFDGLIVPDLPLEESDELLPVAERHGLAVVQLVTPLTPAARAARLAERTRGFLYAVTRTGITGAKADTGDVRARLAELRRLSAAPVCAGFGLRSPEQVHALRDVVDGAIVGTALLEPLLAGGDPLPLLDALAAAARGEVPAGT